MGTSYQSRLGTSPEEGIKAPCKVSTVGDIILTGEQTINGISVVAGDRVLVRLQTDTTENGIYNAAAGTWARSTDLNKSNDIENGVLVVDAHMGYIYQLSITSAYEAGVSSISFPLSAISSALATSFVSDAQDEVGYAAEWANKAEGALISVAAGGDNATDYSSLHNALKAAADRVLAQTAKTASETAKGLSETAKGLSETARDDSQTAQTASEAAQAFAETAQALTETALDSFDDKYLGAFAVDPVLDNDGDPLVDGAIYWNTVGNVMWAYDLSGATWVSWGVSPSAGSITNIPYGDISSTNIQAALNELDDEKEPADATILKDADLGSTVQAHDPSTAKLDVQQEYSRSQHYTPAALIDGATIDWDMDTQPDATVTIAGDRTMNLPTNIDEGKPVVLRVRQDATGSRALVWNAAFLFGDDGAPTLSTVANKYDILTFKGLSATQLMFTGIKTGF